MVAHPPRRRYVLEGRVVTMGQDGVLDDAAVYIADGTIEAVLTPDAPPPDPTYRDAPRIRTGGTILPGFIELHNHLAYNAMPLWDVPRRYSNNGQWRGIESYTRDVTKPAQVIGQTDGAAQALVRYSECRALLGGATTSQGITLASASGIQSYYRGLVRNAEQPDDPRLPRAGTSIANPSTGGALAYLDRLSNHTCYLQHLSEGVDDTARGWFERLRIDDTAWAITDALCGIHSTALNEGDFRLMADRGATMVWSPVSNYLLYGETTDVAAAKAAGMTIALGCDWAPSGSKNLLGELKVAWLASEEMGGVFTPRELVEMVTINAARALKWDEHIGTVEPGRIADLVVFNGRTDDPYETVLQARESTIVLTIIDGVPRVGQPRFLRRFWDEPLDDAPWIDHLTIDRSQSLLYLEHEDDLLDGLPLSAAIDQLTDAMARLPELAAQVDAAVGIGNAISASGEVAFGGGMRADGEMLRVVPDFEQQDAQAAIATLGFALASQPYAFWVTEPIALDPITVIDDRQHLRALLAARNVPEFVKKGLPGLYGQTIPLPDSGRFLEDADEVDPGVLATTADLHTLLTTFGELTLAERKRIVDQAMVVLEDNYVHLPLKQAMHAVDPLQRLRLLRHRLDTMTDATMPPEIEFHNEVTAIFTSVRDLHTGYRLPVPFATKVAWLPFLIEAIHDRGATSYVLTHWVADAWPDDAMRGAQVTHWNGMPMEVAIARNGDRHAGSNPDARHARGLSSLTIRPLSAGFPPDEDWVTLRYLDADGQGHEHHQEWLVFEPGSAVGPSALATEATRIGMDDRADEIQQARKMLYAPAVSAAERAADGQFVATAMHDAVSDLESHLPGVFRAMRVRHSEDGDDGPEYGYLRIFTFHVPDADAFIDEFVRLADLLPDTGLVIDVRGNGGGLITAAEGLLQVLTPHHIEPEPTQFINSPLNLRICRNHRASTRLPGLDLEPWIDSMALAVRTAATYSLGFPITTPAEANARGQAYYGPSVLITDPLCYSATDMFAAGFQDHGIGPVIGVGGATGAGGANVWQHGLLRLLMEPDNEDPGPSPYAPLPRGADLRVAIRRTIRVGRNAGLVLEDLGVQPDIDHRMTRRDVLERNHDLLDTAIEQLRQREPHSIQVTRVQRHRDRAPTVRLRTRNIDRVDARAGRTWLPSQRVRRGSVSLDLDGTSGVDAGETIHLDVLGYQDDEVVANLRTTIPVG